ncbi:MAG: hypothetical protein JWO94_2527 [Verrucomicrobiaceae bacterium]|nr:hypothetical protein [Verrucomicrobiaceae bacterium]
MNRVFLMAGFLALAASSGVRAALTLQLTPDNLAVAAGGAVIFQGLLTNTSTTDKLFLNDIQASLTGDASANVTLKSNTFFANVPGILLPGETYNGPLFLLKLGDGAPSAIYSGSIAINGGTDIFTSAALASSSFTLMASPLEQWRNATFGASAHDAAAADLADWDHDGVPNLLEYALGMDAKTADRGALPAPLVLSDHLALSYVPAATDVTYVVQSSTDLVQWSSADVEPVSIANPDPASRLTFRCKKLLSTSGRLFMRIKVTR